MSNSIACKPWEVKPGDRIQGTGMVATGPGRYTGEPIAWNEEGWVVPVMFDGRAIDLPKTNQSTIWVIREGSNE